MGLEPASVSLAVCPVRVFILTNMNISETSEPVGIKFYLKHHWGAEKSVFGFGPI